MYSNIKKKKNVQKQLNLNKTYLKSYYKFI